MNLQQQVADAVERQASSAVRGLIVAGVEFDRTIDALSNWFDKQGVKFGSIGPNNWVWQTTEGDIPDETHYLTFHEMLPVMFAYVEREKATA
jgi:hypothetical protein